MHMPDGTYQTIFSSNLKELKEFGPDIIYLCIGSEHISLDKAETTADQIISLIKSAQSEIPCEFIVNNFI